jgi:hypothetical protein
MNPHEESLAKGLRELAADSPQGAPAELGAKLRDAFERHHSRRRQKRIALLASLAVILGIAVASLRVGEHHRRGTEANQKPRTVQTSPVPPAVVAHEAQTIEAGSVRPRPAASRTRRRISAGAGAPRSFLRTAAVAPNDFLALPSYDPAIPIGPSRMLRLELPGSALQLVGYPVNEELLERRVLTDVLVGQDGVPYAVRLIQAQAMASEVIH